MFPVAIDDFSVSGDLLYPARERSDDVDGVSTISVRQREDDEHLSDHVYDDLDLASSVFRLFADIKRKLV